MDANTTEAQEADAALLEQEFSDMSEIEVTVDDIRSSDASSTPVATIGREGRVSDPSRSNRRIAGGIMRMADDLGSKARDLKHAVMLLEQQRPQIDAAEANHDRVQEEIDRVVSRLKEESRTLRSTMDAAKNGDLSANVQTQFGRCGKTMEDLEGAVMSLASNLLWLRSVWEQHVHTAQLAAKMKEDLRH